MNFLENSKTQHYKHILITVVKVLQTLLNYISVMFSYLEQQVHSACVRMPPGSVI